MAPRKPPLIPLTDLIGDAVKSQRNKAEWTQGDLADRMKSAGFNWSRQAVIAVENRSRQVSVPELLGLASVFGVSIDRLIWSAGSRVEVAKGSDGSLTIDDSTALLALVVDAEAIGLLAETKMAATATRMFSETYKRLTDAYQERTEAAAAELRSLAGYLETEMMEKMRDALYAPLKEEQS